jgi:hypothetical protein
MLDELFYRHDLGYSVGDMDRADLDLIYGLSNLPKNPREWGPGVNPFYARMYSWGARTYFILIQMKVGLLEDISNLILHKEN